MGFKYLSSLILFAVLWLSAKSQQTHLIRPVFNSDAYKITNIREITQDQYGFIWIGTQDGLVRSGSKIVESYTAGISEKHNLKTSDIRSVVIDSSNGKAWVSGSSGGINVINLITGQIEYSNLLYSNDKAISISRLCNYGEYILIASSTGVFYINKKNFQLTKIKEFEAVNIFNVLIQKDKLIAFTQSKGIVFYDLRRSRIIQQIPVKEFSKSTDIVFYETAITQNGFIVASTDGLKPFKILENNIVYDGNLLNFMPNSLKGIVFGICIDQQQNIWFSTENNLVKTNLFTKQYSIIRNAAVDRISDWLSSVYTLFCDGENNIWLGCQQGLAYLKNSNPSIKSISSKFNTCSGKLTQAYYIYPQNDSTTYVCAENGLYKANFKKGEMAALFSGTAFDYYYNDEQIGTLVSNANGLFTYEQNKLRPITFSYPEFRILGKVRINSIVRFGDRYILGTENYKGIIVWNLRTGIIKNFDGKNDDTFKESIINNVVQISKNEVAILGDTYFSVFNIETFVNKTYTISKGSKSNYSIYFDLAKLKQKYYVACYGSGVIVLDSSFKFEKEISTQNGLSNNGVYKLFSWHDSLLFITTNNGLNCLNIRNNKIKTYYETDGLHDNVFEETSGNILNDEIYAGGKSGISTIIPANFSNTVSVPKVFFYKLSTTLTNNLITDTVNINTSLLYVSNNSIQANINFIGINYSNPERTVYQYRITEQSSSWINLSTQNFITLIGLSPGKYHLQVKAANEDGSWSEPKELILEFLPKWYQTWWFKLLVFLTIVGIIYAFYRYRIRQIEKQHAIRKNIATDLHDDLGSTLNSVKVFTNLAISGVKQEESLQQVKDNLTEATMSLRDMIWVLDDSLDTVDELITRLKQFAIPVASASNIEAVIKADSEVNSRQLTKEEKRNLFLICKEAINNSIKYSGAGQIDVGITASGKKIKIVVADNGNGFNVDEVKKGYGLKNMQYRAGQIKYKVALTSSPGKGTQINILPV
ncbi:ATP-binding protein [Ferruginibacter sp. SUN106]|uniref:sensor histidine kinase n=1 Tax=Ferruginibacter sp. SUN106 TaxID=2978348 RepID=UPI003D3652F0